MKLKHVNLKQVPGKEEFTREVPNVGLDALRNLDERGIIIPGSEVKEGDILVGKITPKGMFEPSPSENLSMLSLVENPESIAIRHYVCLMVVVALYKVSKFSRRKMVSYLLGLQKISEYMLFKSVKFLKVIRWQVAMEIKVLSQEFYQEKICLTWQMVHL